MANQWPLLVDLGVQRASARQGQRERHLRSTKNRLTDTIIYAVLRLFGKLPIKVGKLPIVTHLTIPGPNLTQAYILLLKMAQKDSLSHFSDLDF